MNAPRDDREATSLRPRRGLVLLACGLAGVALLWGGLALWRDGRYRESIARIELMMASGRFGAAARDLTALLQQQPGADEAAVLLGRCEKERGRFEAAAAALARVPPGSPFAHQATLARMRLAHDEGQFARAEEIILEAAADPRNDGPHLRFLLVPIYSQLGRIDEALRLIEERWEGLRRAGEGASEPAIDLVRMHIDLAFKPNPAEAARAYLEQAARMALDDDRVWLGQANLAIRTGDFAEARRRLDACLARRPDDPAAWDAFLRLGMAAGQAELVEKALAHLPSGFLTPARTRRARAWLAARRGDAISERRELEALLLDNPADQEALARLADLATKAGDADRDADLRRRQSEVKGLLERYQALHARVQPFRDAEQLAALAERLGRTFEARVFLTLALAEDPDRPDLRESLKRLERCGDPARSSPPTREAAGTGPSGPTDRLDGLRADRIGSGSRGSS